MKRIIAVLCVLAIAVSGISGCKKASDKTDWEYIEDKGELIIGITLFAPMNYKGEDGNLTGFETEFAEAVCEELGVKAKFLEIVWDNKIINLKDKSIDCVWNGMTIKQEIKDNADISTPYLKNRQVMVVKKENESKYLTAESVTDAVVVAEAGSAGETLATKNDFFKTAKFTPVDTQAKAMFEVKAGTADISLFDYVMSIASIGEGTDFSDLVAVTDLEFDPEEYGVAIRKDSPETLKKLNAAMQAVADSGKLLTIAKKYKLEDLLLIKGK